jgi:hypothetical protein
MCRCAHHDIGEMLSTDIANFQPSGKNARIDPAVWIYCCFRFGAVATKLINWSPRLVVTGGATNAPGHINPDICDAD